MIALLAAAAVQTACISNEDVHVLKDERAVDFNVGTSWTMDAEKAKARRLALARAHLAPDEDALEGYDRENGAKLLAVAKALDHVFLAVRACKP